MDTLHLKKKARVAGGWYLLLAITSTFGLVYVPSKLIVQGDTLATVQHIAASPLLFRLGILSNFIYLTVFVCLVLAFYDLFKRVDQKLALLLVGWVVVAIPIAFANELNKFAILALLEDDGLKALKTSPLPALVPLFLALYEYGSFAVMLFWGLWLFPLGILVIKSTFIPRVLGGALVIGGGGYAVASVTFLFSVQYGRLVFPWATFPSAIAELSMIFWLLVKGAKQKNAPDEPRASSVR